MRTIFGLAALALASCASASVVENPNAPVSTEAGPEMPHPPCGRADL